MTDSPLGDTNAAATALARIAAEYGPDPLSSPTRLSGLLADLLPDQPRLVRLLVAAAEDDIAGNMRRHLAAGVDVATATSLSAAAFAEASVFLPEACAWVVGAIAVALGLADEIPVVPARPVPVAAAAPTETSPAADRRMAGDMNLAPGTPQPTGRTPGALPEQVRVPQSYGPPGTLLATLAHDRPVTAMRFSPDGSRILTTSKDMTAVLWQVEDGRELALMRHSRGVADAVFSSNGARIVTRHTPPAMGSSRIATLWAGTDGRELAQLEHRGNVLAAGFSADSSRIATSDERTVRLWDAFAGMELARIPNDMWAESLSFSADSAWLVATSDTVARARLWAVATAQEEAWLQRGDALRAVLFSPDSTRMVTLTTNLVARLFEPTTRRQVPWVERMDAMSAAFSPDSRMLATASSDRVVRLWSADSGRQLATLRHDSAVREVTFSADGGLLATTGQDMSVRLWDPASGQELARLPHDHDVTMAAFSRRGPRLCTVSGGVVRLWDVTTGRALGVTGRGEAWVAAMSPDGSRVGIAGHGTTARLWDSQSGTEIASLQHDDRVMAISFSPDGRLLATRADRQARLWAT